MSLSSLPSIQYCTSFAAWAEDAGTTHVPFPSMMEPAEVGQLVLQAVQNNDLYIITHGEWRSMAQARHAELIAAMPEKLNPALVAMLQGRG